MNIECFLDEDEQFVPWELRHKMTSSAFLLLTSGNPPDKSDEGGRSPSELEARLNGGSDVIAAEEVNYYLLYIYIHKFTIYMYILFTI